MPLTHFSNRIMKIKGCSVCDCVGVGWGRGLMCVGGAGGGGGQNLLVISQNKECEEINLCENSEGLEPACLIRVFAIRLVIAESFCPIQNP